MYIYRAICRGAGVAIRLLFEGKVKRIIINDYDRSIYAVWYSILNSTDDFITLIEETDITTENLLIQKNYQEQKEPIDLLTLGFSTFFLNRTNRSGIIKAGVIGGKNQLGNYKMNCRFNKKSLIELIKKIKSNERNIELYNLDALDFIKAVQRKHNQFYFIAPLIIKKVNNSTQTFIIMKTMYNSQSILRIS